MLQFTTTDLCSLPTATHTCICIAFLLHLHNGVLGPPIEGIDGYIHLTCARFAAKPLVYRPIKLTRPTILYTLYQRISTLPEIWPEEKRGQYPD